ncbi:M66 family metalloprotease [Thermus arciformis]|uniref:M66 family metalloprotease n=1 Tax=Thermus arciformis TaxID=482827 RepID=UPI001F4B1F2E|nr:M66 family metalloprotease [Thermus arciformis]
MNLRSLRLWAFVALLAACSGPPENQPPTLTAFQASPSEGEAPLAVRFAWSASDPDGEALECVLEPGDGAKLSLSPCGTGYTYTYTSPGDYQTRLEVKDGKGASARRETLVRVRPRKGFALALSPTSLSVQQGGQGQVTLTVTPQNGFTGTVNLSLVDSGGNPVAGVGLSPTSVSVSGASPVNQALTLAVASSVNPGTYALKVRGTSGSLTQEVNLTLTVTAPSGGGDFSLVLESSSLSISPGGTSYVRLSVTGTYTGQISLSLVDENGSPFTSVQLSPTQIPVPSAPMLELRAVSDLSPGTYALRLRGTGGGLTKEANLTLRVTSTQNLAIAKVEWGQTVLEEDLRLVAGKPALLRVHLVASPDPMALAQPLSGAVYTNTAFLGNLSFTCPSPIPTDTVQGNLRTTCNATLPAEWMAPGLRVELRADPGDQVAESDEGDNARTLSPQVGAGTVLHLTAVPVVHQGVTASVPDFRATLWRVWPLKDIAPATRAPYTFAGTLSPNDAMAWSQLLDELRLLRQADGSRRYYYGFVRVGYTSGIAGIGYIGYPVAVGWDYPQSAPAVMAHELGHNFGREHAPCGTSGDPSYPYANGQIGTWGYDLASGALKDPAQHYDLMSYCGPKWVSDYTYQGAQAFLENRPPSPQGLPGEGLLFSGRILGDQVVFNPPVRLAAHPEGEPSSYTLRVDGREYPVYVLRDSEGGLHFQAKVPVGPWNRVGLYREGALLAEAQGGVRPQAEPRVELKEEGGFLVARWTGYPFLSLFHVAEDGARTALGLWHRGGESRFALEGLPPGGAFEAQLSDGLGVMTLFFPR